MTFEIYRQGEQIQLQVEIGSKTESALKNEEEAEKEQAENDGAVTEPEQLPQDPQEFPGFGANPFEDFFSIFGF